MPKTTWYTPQRNTPQFGPPCKPLKKRNPYRRKRKGKTRISSKAVWHYVQERSKYHALPVKRGYLSDQPLDYDTFLTSPYWLKLRREVLAKRKVCEDCGNTQRLQLHHNYYYRHGRSVLYHERDFPDIFAVLCYACHHKRHRTAET